MSAKNNSKTPPQLWHPRFWTSWAGMALWWSLVQILPFRLQMVLGGWLGRLAGRLSKRRRRITRKNLALCFPEKSEEERETLYTQSMEAAGRAFFESGMAWFWPRWRLQKRYRIQGLEHLQKAREEGRGVIFLGIHFTTIEMCAAFMNIAWSIDGFYRPHKNPVYEWVQRYGRERHNPESQTIPRKDVRGIIRTLKSGRVINYTTDQDFGARHSVFVPFFNIPTATVTAPSQLARVAGAVAIPYTTRANANLTGYEITIYPPIEGFGSGDEQEEAAAFNAFIEARVRENPGQYLWSHRRFKTRPDGEKDFYKVQALVDKSRRKR